MPFSFDRIDRKSRLLEILRQKDIRVPARTAGRTTDHTEIWSMCRLLASIQEHPTVRYPISLTHQDRPDFLLTCDDHQIGVEVTESVPVDLARMDALAEHDESDALIELSEFGYHAPTRSLAELRKLLTESRDGKLKSDGWADDQPEQEWAMYIADSIRTKLKKLSDAGFSKYESNWLLIYDNLPFMGLDLERCTELLRQKTEEFWSLDLSFDRIFVEHEHTIIEIEATRTVQHSLVDLWKAV